MTEQREILRNAYVMACVAAYRFTTSLKAAPYEAKRDRLPTHPINACLPHGVSRGSAAFGWCAARTILAA
jgi:hypothetical protein